MSKEIIIVGGLQFKTLDQPIIPSLIFFFILVTCLLDMVLMCKEKFCLGHWWDFKG